ncbi:RNA guanine-N7 methyltransferase activating subunit-like [Centroberyx gerrardi]|uniref:RNA guanine-N7 methyltransferase activating subunit-like n=1 Tax=Centroberyx gerrardi TaxID=166262 RepID=UPI003AACBFFF
MAETTENLPDYEDQFANRFSKEDREYQEYVSRPADPPPIVEDWRGRAGGNSRGRGNRFQDRRGHRGQGWGGGGGGGGGRGWGGDRSWGGEQREQQHSQDRDRRWGHGSGHQSGPPGYNQGYNSYNQRSNYDRY